VLAELKQKLEDSVQNLSDAVAASLSSIAKKYGADSCFTKRLESYTSGISRQKILVGELGVALNTNNFYEVSRLAVLIISMTTMMKDDARILLEEVQTGSTCETPEDVIH